MKPWHEDRHSGPYQVPFAAAACPYKTLRRVHSRRSTCIFFPQCRIYRQQREKGIERVEGWYAASRFSSGGDRSRRVPVVRTPHELSSPGTVHPLRQPATCSATFSFPRFFYSPPAHTSRKPQNTCPQLLMPSIIRQHPSQIAVTDILCRTTQVLKFQTPRDGSYSQLSECLEHLSFLTCIPATSLGRELDVPSRPPPGSSFLRPVFRTRELRPSQPQPSVLRNIQRRCPPLSAPIVPEIRQRSRSGTSLRPLPHARAESTARMGAGRPFSRPSRIWQTSFRV